MVGFVIAFKTKKKVKKALIIEEINPIAVIGFEIFLNKGPNKATKPPAIIEIKYLGYLATLEKNSPINITNRLLF